jgi:uncharacterized protein (TIGR02466 family)
MNTKSFNLNIFSIVIQYFNNFITNEECLDVIEKCKTFNLQKNQELKNNAVSTFNMGSSYVLNNFSKLKEIIIQKVNNYENELGLFNSTLNNSWVNFQYKYSVLKKHQHPGSQISGVLYLKTDEKSSKIYFYNPNPYNSFIKKKEEKYNNFEHISFCPKIGDLILFPSWLSHGSHNDENLSEERIALSFNSKLIE